MTSNKTYGKVFGEPGSTILPGLSVHGTAVFHNSPLNVANPKHRYILTPVQVAPGGTLSVDKTIWKKKIAQGKDKSLWKFNLANGD